MEVDDLFGYKIQNEKYGLKLKPCDLCPFIFLIFINIFYLYSVLG